MSGIEGSGLVSPISTGSNNAVGQIPVGESDILVARGVAPVIGDRKQSQEQHRRDRRPAPKQARPETSGNGDAPISAGDQVLVALDDALVRQTEGGPRTNAAAAIGDYQHRLTNPSETLDGHTLSIEA